MDSDDVIELYEALEAFGVEVWVGSGGWGVDALLGEQTREHADLDVQARMEDVERLKEILEQRGFSLVEGGSRNNFLLRDGRGREVDVHVIRIDEQGNGIYRTWGDDDWIYPAEALRGRGWIAGREVRCLTPEMEMICHSAGYEPGEDDFQDMRALHERFGVALMGPYAPDQVGGPPSEIGAVTGAKGDLRQLSAVEREVSRTVLPDVR